MDWRSKEFWSFNIHIQGVTGQIGYGYIGVCIVCLMMIAATFFL